MSNNALSVPSFSSNAVTEFGNKVLYALVAQAGAEQEATRLSQQASEAKKFIGFEMTRAIFELAKTDDDINPHAVFGGAKEVSALNLRILVAMGVMETRPSADMTTIEKVWVDPKLEALYQVNEKIKKDDEKEYQRRQGNWRRLTLQIGNACRAATELLNAGLDAGDLYYSEGENGEQLPTLKKAPKEIQGSKRGEVVLGKKTPRDGASKSATLASLIDLAKSRNAASKPARGDKGDVADGDAKMGMSDEDFTAAINVVIRNIQKQEKRFTAQMAASMKSLQPVVNEAVKAGVSKK